MASPAKGIAENRLVITVAPQKLICPQGKT
jgi:hypothetical protein